MTQVHQLMAAILPQLNSQYHANCDVIGHIYLKLI